MATSHKRSRPKRKERRPVLLVTNGRTTERDYLDHLKQKVDRSIAVTTQFINGDPLTITKELSRPRGDLSDFAEVWIVVDHDGEDRREFLLACRRLSSKRTVVHGVVSVPCFEVWLNAHYERVRNYRDQNDAQRHYRALTGLEGKEAKTIPADFPWNQAAEAEARCHLPSVDLPKVDTQGPCPSTTMPHLLRSLGLL